MATLHIRNFPDAVKDLLEQRAKENGRSMNNEAIEVIKLGLNQNGRDQAELWQEIDANSPGWKGDVDIAGIIREEREKRTDEIVSRIGRIGDS